jgi:hypothetical protein
MASKFDKIYFNLTLPDQNKINNILSKSDDMDTHDILQTSVINNIPLPIIIDKDGNNLIHLALINIKNKDEFTVLNYIKFLVNKLVNPDQPNKENQTPLIIACQKQYEDIVDYFITLNVDTNFKDNTGLTPIHYLLSGTIKPYNVKEITEFIVPKLEKEEKINNDDYNNLKQQIWTLIKNESFIKSIESTINYYYLFMFKKFNFKFNLNKNITDETNLNKNKLISILKNLNKELYDYTITKWDFFKKSPSIIIHNKESDSISYDKNIGIIKNSNIKKNIKNNIKNSIDYMVNLINTYNYEGKKTKLNDFISNIIINNIKNAIDMPKIPIPTSIATVIKTPEQITFEKYDEDCTCLNVNDEVDLNNIYNNLKCVNSIDFADNMIDITNLSFIGGSRLIKTNNNNYITQRNLLITNNDIINSLNNPNEIDKINFNNNNFFKIYNDYMIRNVDIELNCYNVPLLIMRVFSAYINNQNNNLEKSFIQTCKIDNFFNIINNIYNEYDIIAYWAGYLLNEINIELNNIIYNIEFNKIKKITDKIKSLKISNIEKDIDDFESIKQLISTDIILFYNNMNNKFPKLYLDDLLFYLYNPDVLKYIKTINFITDINDNNYNNDFLNLIKNLIINNIKLPPSFYGYHNVINDILYDNFDSEYLDYKFLESLNLGLHFNGCFPNLMSPIHDYFSVKYTNDRLFIFNPAIFQELDINKHDLPLPFNYCNVNDDNNIPVNKIKYFKYIEHRYRPPAIFSLLVLYENQFYYYNNKLQINLNLYKNILESLLSKKQKIKSIYYDYFIELKLLNIKQIEINDNLLVVNNLLNVDKSKDNLINNIKLFNYTEFIEKLNKINFYIFCYYYLYKNTNIPEFIYNNFNDRLILYSSNNKNDLIGGAINTDNNLINTNNNLINTDNNLINTDILLLNKDFILDKTIKLPPSIYDYLYEFYELNKMKFITENLEKFIHNIYFNNINDLNLKNKAKKNLRGIQVALIMDELIKNYCEYLLKKGISITILSYLNNIDNFELNNNFELINTEYTPPFIHLNSINDLNLFYNKLNNNNTDILLNFYNFSNNNINKPFDEKNNFIIYPNEYSNTNLIKIRNCLTIKIDIFKKLLNKNAQPYLLDNNNNNCLINVLYNLNFNVIDEVKKLDINFDLKPYIIKEIFNHNNKMIIENSFNKSIEIFVKPQYNEIKTIILADNDNGNNLLFNLQNSFNICFYIMSEYLTDQLWYTDEHYNKNDFNKIITFLNYDKDDIFINYLSKISNNNKDKLKNFDQHLINIDLIKQITNDNNKLHKYLNKNNIKINNTDNIILKTELINKRKIIQNEITKNNNKIIVLNNLSKDQIYFVKSIYKTKIIKTYDDLINNNYGVYTSMWNILLNDDNLLNNSINLSLLNILNTKYFKTFNKIDDEEIINIYFNHISKTAHSYFDNNNYLNNNKVLQFIYDLLIHLTKSHICFGIEIIVRKILFNNLKLIYHDYDIDLLKGIIDRLLNSNYMYVKQNNTFIDILYNEVPEKFVKNSLLIFKDIEDKTNFESETVNEILENLFNILKSTSEEIILTDNIMNNLNTNVKNYFNLFVEKIIKNWYVVCENMLKYIINHHRMTKILYIVNN